MSQHMYSKIVVASDSFKGSLSSLEVADAAAKAINFTAAVGVGAYADSPNLDAALTYLRSPYYALGYAANDVVLIVLWVLASVVDISYLSMVVCFIMFLVNDLYGFINWRRMQRKQGQHL